MTDGTVDKILAPIQEVLDDLVAGTHAFMADYEAQGHSWSRRISGESAALIVEQREVLRGALEQAIVNARAEAERAGEDD